MAARRFTIIRRALLALGMAWLLSFVAVLAWGTHDGAVPSDAIVVLGAAQYDGHPSPVLKARLDHAISLYRREFAPRIVTTGGQGKGDTTSEAAVGRRYALRDGIPAEALLLEGSGRSTSASLEAVSALMHERHLERVVLVSDPFHLLRLSLLAHHYGMHASTSPTRTSPISANRSEMLGYILSESVKVPLTLVWSLFHEVAGPR